MSQKSKNCAQKEHYHYTKVMMLQKFNFEGFLKALYGALFPKLTIIR